MATGEIVQIFNRTTRTLTCMKGGRQHTIPPGLSYVTFDVVMYARQQNPVPGSEDYQSLEYESLISLVAAKGQKQKHPLDVVPDDVLDALGPERLNRASMQLDRQVGQTMTTAFPRGRVGVEDPTENMLDPTGAIK